MPYDEQGERTVRESHGHGDEFCLQLVVLRQGNVIGLGDPIRRSSLFS